MDHEPVVETPLSKAEKESCIQISFVDRIKMVDVKAPPLLPFSDPIL